MRVSLRRVVIGVALLLITIAISVIGYVMAGWTVMDALYFVIITIYGVGYEEVHDIGTGPMKLFTIFVIVVGTGSAIYIIGGVVQMAAEGEIQRVLGARRQTRGIESLHNHVIVCGFGRMGQILARELSAAGIPFLIIDTSETRKAEAEEQGYLVLLGDATDEATLRLAHIEHAQSVATVLPNDAMNVFITLSARNLNPDLKILARGELPSTEPKLLQAGANHVVLPAAIGGRRLAHMILRPSTSALLEQVGNIDHINDDLEALGIEISEVPIESGSACIGKTLGDVHVEGEGTYLIVAVRRASGEFVRLPGADLPLDCGDIVVLIGRGKTEPKLTTGPTPATKVVSESGGAGSGDETSV